ncbi:histidine kinase [Microbacterium sp.]|uniref:sensor histidine kinase n=1 Tax=Microbacterium sp. TaxID=51671 RepID=UPI0025F78301|nr:histidine kinase [Microbacterium sp.]MBT9607821.1 hypothetical protein [Microbacterium sp.]
MSTSPVAPVARVRSWLRGASTMNRVERTALLVLLLAGLGVGVIALIVAEDGDDAGALFELVVTALFALYLWSAAAGTASLGAAVVLSFPAGLPQQTLLAFAIAAICVVRLGTPALMLAYAAAFAVASIAVARESVTAPAMVVGYLVVAVVLGGIGLLLRAAHARGERLDAQLARAREREHAAAALERRRLAGDLHDGIAHDLTVIALHAQLLDDDDVEVRQTAQDTIRLTARNALGDLRYLIEIADDGAAEAPGFSPDPAAAVREAADTLEAAGYPVDVETSALPRAPRRVGVVFARVLRECVTNVLKHAGPGPVVLTVQARDAHAELTVRNALPAVRRDDLPSAGTGVDRMGARVRELGGELRAAAEADEWVVVARMPLA